MMRAFLAAELPDRLRERLAVVQQDLRRRLDESGRNGRIVWVQPASIHLTVKFLGDMEDGLIDPLRDALAPLAAERLPLTMPLERLGVFPHPQQPRVVWAGPFAEWERSPEAARLMEFHRVVEERCHLFGFLPEAKPWNPHITLARIKGGDRPVGHVLAQRDILDRPVALGPLTIASLALMTSELRPGGPVYTVVWRIAPS